MVYWPQSASAQAWLTKMGRVPCRRTEIFLADAA